MPIPLASSDHNGLMKGQKTCQTYAKGISYYYSMLRMIIALRRKESIRTAMRMKNRRRIYATELFFRIRCADASPLQQNTFPQRPMTACGNTVQLAIIKYVDPAQMLITLSQLMKVIWYKN